MRELDELERRVLDGARQSLEPAAADQSRVWAALSLELGTAAIVAGPSMLAQTRTLSASEATKTVGGSLAVKWSTLVGSAALIGAAGFGSGYFVGTSADHRDSVTATQLRATPLPTLTPSPVARVVEQASEQNVVRQTNTQRPGRAAQGRSAVAVPSAPAARPAAGDDAFYEELSLLQRAERAIRSNNPMVALALLGDLDEQYPRGKLLEERAAARVMAGCQQSLDANSQGAARRFLASRPQSVYAGRVQSLCALTLPNEEAAVANIPAKGSSAAGH